MQTRRERRGHLQLQAGLRASDSGLAARDRFRWPSSLPDRRPRDETRELPSRANFYRHRVVFSAKQTKRKEGQQDIRSFFSFSMADVSGNQNSEWNQRGFQFAGILLPGCKSRGSGEAFVQKSLPNLSAHAQKSIVSASLLWHKPNMSFCLLYNHPSHTDKTVSVTSLQMLVWSFPDYGFGWRRDGRTTAGGSPCGRRDGQRAEEEGCGRGWSWHSLLTRTAGRGLQSTQQNQRRKSQTERQATRCDSICAEQMQTNPQRPKADPWLPGLQAGAGNDKGDGELGE